MRRVMINDDARTSSTSRSQWSPPRYGHRRENDCTTGRELRRETDNMSENLCECNENPCKMRAIIRRRKCDELVRRDNAVCVDNDKEQGRCRDERRKVRREVHDAEREGEGERHERYSTPKTQL